MAGFRQEDVELYYEMGEELGRYIYILMPFYPLLTNQECLKMFA